MGFLLLVGVIAESVLNRTLSVANCEHKRLEPFMFSVRYT
jgi:hypothetical protein